MVAGERVDDLSVIVIHMIGTAHTEAERERADLHTATQLNEKVAGRLFGVSIFSLFPLLCRPALSLGLCDDDQRSQFFLNSAPLPHRCKF
jgi:hypothetical protein